MVQAMATPLQNLQTNFVQAARELVGFASSFFPKAPAAGPRSSASEDAKATSDYWLNALHKVGESLRGPVQTYLNADLTRESLRWLVVNGWNQAPRMPFSPPNLAFTRRFGLSQGYIQPGGFQILSTPIAQGFLGVFNIAAGLEMIRASVEARSAFGCMTSFLAGSALFGGGADILVAAARSNPASLRFNPARASGYAMRGGRLGLLGLGIYHAGQGIERLYGSFSSPHRRRPNALLASSMQLGGGALALRAALRPRAGGISGVLAATVMLGGLWIDGQETAEDHLQEAILQAAGSNLSTQAECGSLDKDQIDCATLEAAIVRYWAEQEPETKSSALQDMIAQLNQAARLDHPVMVTVLFTQDDARVPLGFRNKSLSEILVLLRDGSWLDAWIPA